MTFSSFMVACECFIFGSQFDLYSMDGKWVFTPSSVTSMRYCSIEVIVENGRPSMIISSWASEWVLPPSVADDTVRHCESKRGIHSVAEDRMWFWGHRFGSRFVTFVAHICQPPSFTFWWGRWAIDWPEYFKNGEMVGNITAIIACQNEHENKLPVYYWFCNCFIYVITRCWDSGISSLSFLSVLFSDCLFVCVFFFLPLIQT